VAAALRCGHGRRNAHTRSPLNAVGWHRFLSTCLSIIFSVSCLLSHALPNVWDGISCRSLWILLARDGALEQRGRIINIDKRCTFIPRQHHACGTRHKRINRTTWTLRSFAAQAGVLSPFASTALCPAHYGRYRTMTTLPRLPPLGAHSILYACTARTPVRATTTCWFLYSVAYLNI